MRKILIGIVILLVALVAAAFVGPQFIPGDALKAQIAAQVHAATSRDLIIDGDLSFTLLPVPGVKVSDVRVSNIKGAQADNMVRLKSAQVVVALGPLITGDIEIQRVVLVDPVFELEQLADGVNNWTFAPPQTSADEGGGDSGTASASGGLASSIQLNDLVVRGGTVVFRSPDITERIEGIDASFSAGSLRGPFQAEGKAVLFGMPANLRAAIGELVTNRAIPVSLTTSTLGAEISFSGLLSGFPNDLRISGPLEGKAADIGAVIAAASGQSAAVSLAAAPLAIKGNLSVNHEAVALNDLVVGLGAINATGAANISLGEKPGIGLILNAGQLDLDRLLKDFELAQSRKGKAPPRASKAPASGTSARKAGGGATTGTTASFTLPPSLNVAVETRVNALLYRGGVMRQIALNAQLTDGEVTISQLTAQLPGSADISLFGFVAARDGVPHFSGQGEVNADNIRALLTWLGADVSAVPLDRLRKLALTAKLNGIPSKLNVTDIDLGFDGTRVRGGIAVALRKRLGLGIGLSLDKLNIDAYLPTAAKSPTPDGTAAQQSAKKPRGGTATVPLAAVGVAVLDSFDSVLQLKANTLTYRGKSIQGVNIDGTLVAGTFELRDASVKSLVGARAKASGKIAGLATAAPTVDLNLDINSEQSDRLLQMLGVALSFTVGSGRLQGSVKGNLDTLDMDLTLAALAAKLTTKGKVSSLAIDPNFDVKLDLRHSDARALFFSINGNGRDAKAGRSPGALRVAAAVTGSLAKSELNARITVGAGSLAVKGKVSNINAAQMSGGVAVTANHPDLAQAIRLFLLGYKPALPKPGPLKFSADLVFDPTTLRIDNLRGNAGPVAFESSANVVIDGLRPRVTGELKTSEIIVDWFLPVQNRRAPAAGAPSAPLPGSQQAVRARPAGGRWSDERLDFSILRNVDGDVALTAPSITYADLKLDKPKALLRLADGVLDLSELSGRAYGGTLNIIGQVTDRKVPSLNYVLNIKGADAAQFTRTTGQEGLGVMSVLDLLFPVSSVKIASGTLDAKIEVASRGRSERELIGALSGNGNVRFANAVAEGIDVCRISNQLGNLSGLEGFLGLLLSVQGGTTRIADYAARFDISKGIATLPQQRINAKCATIDIRGNVDLPRWLVDIQARALFPEHPKFPGVIVKEKGSLYAPNTRLVNSNEVQQYIIGKSAGSILRELAPGIEQQPPQDSSGSQPASQPADQLRDLLKDLLKNR